MNIFRLIRDYIEAIRAQTAATMAATLVAERALRDAAFERYRERREGHHGHGHGHGHAHGNASLAGAGCRD